MWSDETKFELYGERHVWKKKNTEYRIDGKMNRAMNFKMFSDNLLASDRALKMGHGWVFQHDNNPRKSGFIRSISRTWNCLARLQTSLLGELKFNVFKCMLKNPKALEHLDNITPEVCASLKELERNI